MPRTKRPKPLYQRGAFKLYPRPGRNLEIVWYDEQARRERSASAGTDDVEVGKLAVDRQYLAAHGSRFCPTCGRQTDGEVAPLLLSAITDYMLKSEGQAGYSKSTKQRLAHVVAYIAATDPGVTVPAITEDWVAKFRAWMGKRTYTRSGEDRRYSLSAIEGCVLQLAAAVNALPGHEAAFKAQSIKAVARSPKYRADVRKLAAMFRYCLDPQPRGKIRWSPKVRDKMIEYRANLLAYLRLAVATWARPDAIYEVNVDRQWHPEAGVLELNPPGRRQTKKYRPVVVVARQMRPLLDQAAGPFIPVSTIKCAWDKMRTELGMPGDGEAGEKLIRRSMATIGRKRLGEANWPQGKMMLGHVKADTSDIYALPDPANLGLALAVTEAVIDEIESLVPGAFTAGLPRELTGKPDLKVVENG